MSAFLANAARGIGIFHGSQYYQRVSAVYNPIQTREVVESISGDSLKTSPRVSDDSPNETTRSSGSENLKSDISASKRNLLEKKINKVENDMKILKIIDSLAAVFGIFGLAIAMIEYEDNFSDVGKERNESSQYGNDLRTFITVTTGFLLIFIVIRSKLSFNIMKEKQMNLDVKVSTYWNSSYLKSLIVELVICAIH